MQSGALITNTIIIGVVVERGSQSKLKQNCCTNQQIALILPPTSFRPFIRYCMKRVNLLRQYDIIPVVVFDGGYLPTKSRVEKDRRE